MADRKDIKRYRANFEEERNSAALYRALAEYEKNTQLADVYRRLAETEEKHADTWASRLRDAGEDVPEFRSSLRTRILVGLGEWISVQSSRELYEKQISVEAEEIKTVPEEETEELVLIYQARGMDEETARLLATRLMSNPDSALDTLARDELGVNPEDLGGSAWQAAITSFLLFAAGAIVPVVPFLFMKGTAAVIVSAGVSAAGLFVVGSAITLFTGKSVLYSGTRQVLFGLAAAAAVFLIGRLVGVGLAG